MKIQNTEGNSGNNKGLKSKILKGSIWLTIGGGSEHALRFLRNMLLARLLVPEAFGTMAIVLAVNGAMESFTQLGIKEAIIQNARGRETTFMNFAWWVSFGRSLILYGIGFLAAPVVAGYYKDDALVMLIRVALLVVVFNGAFSVRAYSLLKDMKYLKWMLIYNGGSILGVICTIGLSFYSRNIWALVFGYVAESALRFILSYCICFYLPKMTFDKQDTNAVIKFSKGMFGLPIFFFIFTKTPVFVLGKLVSKVTLGLYSMTMSLAEIPALFINMVLAPILLPTFSKTIDNKERLRLYLEKLNWLIWLLFLPALGFIAFSGEGVLCLIYGKEYQTQALIFVLLLSSTVFRILSIPVATLYLALGKPELQRLFVILRAVVMLVIIFPAIKLFGPVGAAGASLISNLSAYFIQFVYAKRYVNIFVKNYLFDMLRSMYVLIPLFLVPFVFGSSIFKERFYGLIPGTLGVVFSYCLVFVIVAKRDLLKLLKKEK